MIIIYVGYSRMTRKNVENSRKFNNVLKCFTLWYKPHLNRPTQKTRRYAPGKDAGWRIRAEDGRRILLASCPRGSIVGMVRWTTTSRKC